MNHYCVTLEIEVWVDATSYEESFDLAELKILRIAGNSELDIVGTVSSFLEEEINEE